PELRHERLQQVLERDMRHDHDGPEIGRRLAIEVREPMQGERGLAMARFAEHEHRAAARPEHGLALTGIELAIGQRELTAFALWGWTRGKDRHRRMTRQLRARKKLFIFATVGDNYWVSDWCGAAFGLGALR